MKVKEREKARKLRKLGYSVRGISRRLKCSKSSISVWVRDIPLTVDQISKLKSNQDKARAKAALHHNSPKLKWARIRQSIIEDATKDIPKKPSMEQLRLIGSALYWAEGYTASRRSFVFANTDARMIKLMMKFLRTVCHTTMGKIRGCVNIHPSLGFKKAEAYWANISGIPVKQFHKPLLAISRASKQKRKTLTYGTFRIIISDVRLCSKIKGWIEGLRKWAVSSAG
jgi:hypothetical protein